MEQGDQTTAQPSSAGARRSHSTRLGRAVFPHWVDHNLRVILVSRFAMSVARAIAGVVTALYLAAEGFSSIEIGALFVGVTVVSALLSSGIGLVSDRVGRRPFLVGVPLLAAGAALLYALDRTPAVLFLAAALGSFGRGAGAGGGSVGPYQPAESAFVAESVPAQTRAAAFGRLAFTSALGALVGGLLAGLASVHPHMTRSGALVAYRPAFLAAAALALVAGIVALSLREERHRAPHSAQRRLAWPRHSWPALWRFWVTNGTNGFAIGMTGPFISYWLYRRYGAPPAEIGLLFALVNLASLAATLSASRVGRRLGTVRAIAGVRGLSALLLVPMVLAPGFWFAGMIYLVRMLAQRIGLPLRQSFTQDLAHPAERSSVAALANLPAQATMAGSQAFAGYLFAEVSLAAPFEIASVFQLANALLYVALFTWRPPRARHLPHGAAPADSS